MKIMLEPCVIFTAEEEKIVHNFINFCDNFERELDKCVLIDAEAELYPKVEDIIGLDWEDFTVAAARLLEFVSEETSITAHLFSRE